MTEDRRVKPFPFDVSKATEQTKEGLRQWGDAIVELQKHIRWDEVSCPEGRADIFHTEHCHLPISSDGVLCFGNLYFFNNGDRILCYTSSHSNSTLQMMGGPDELKKSFGWMVSLGLVTAHLSSHVPESPKSRAAH